MRTPFDASRSCLESSIPKEARICVLGATGWIGRTQLAMLAEHPTSNIQLVAASERRLKFHGREWEVSEWDPIRLRSFSPDIVLNFAFLTREKQAKMSPKEYRETNEKLIDQMSWVAQLPDVRCVISVSSGAAVSDAFGSGSEQDDQYGELKRREELAVSELSTADRFALVARAWSLSGPFVTKPASYAFSDFVTQAKSGTIHVKSGNHVYRRYVSVDDFLELAYLEATRYQSRILDSGGELISMTNLALQIAHCQPGDVEVVVEDSGESPSRIYASDNSSWLAATVRNEFQALNLIQQIHVVRNHLGDPL